MKEDLLANLDKYDKDKRQLAYEKDIIELLKNKRSLIKYVHPAIIYKNSEEIIDILGDSNRYLKYLPNSIIKKNQKKIFEYCKYNPELLIYISHKIQLKNVSDVLTMVKKYPLNYDCLDEKIKRDNKELFKYVFNSLFKVKDGYLVDLYYRLSINNNNLLHNMNRVMLNKDLVMVLKDSTKRIINYSEIMKNMEKLSEDKYRFKIFIDLLKLYPDDSYVEQVIDRTIRLVNKDYYFYKKNGSLLSYNKDIFTSLYKDSLSINEIKKLYYILSSDLVHINSRDDFYSFSEIRNKYLSEMNDESIKEIKNIIYEYNYAMSYEEINYLIEKYSNNVDYLISKYKKFRYNVDEIEEYETLLIFREMISINNCSDYNKLRELLDEAYINHKEIRSYDIRINLEDRIRKIYYREYEKVIGRRLNYTSDEKVLYEDVVSKNKQTNEYLGRSVIIKNINCDSIFSIILRKDVDNKKYYNKYEFISNDYINLDYNEYYLRASNVVGKIINIDMNRYELPGKRYSNILVEEEDISSVVSFSNKPSEEAIRKAIDLNVPIEVLDVKNIIKRIENLRNTILNKITHYIDDTVSYEEDERIAKYTPFDCIDLFFNISNNMVLSNNLNKELFTRNIKSIINKIDAINDNYILINQMLIVLKKSLEAIDNTYNKKEIYRDLDKVYRKYNIYVKNKTDFKDILLLLDSNKVNDIKLYNNYNKNQIEYDDVVENIQFDKIAEYIEVLEDNYYYGDVKRIIRISLLSNILADMIDSSLVNLCLLASVFSNIGKTSGVRFGDYSASLFRSIYKKVLPKVDIDIVCAAIDSQDSVEEFEQLKYKYKIKDIDKFIKVSSILKDAIYLDNFKNKKRLMNKEATRLIKIKDVIKNSIYNYEIEVLIRKNIISKRYYDNLLNLGYKYEEIVEICKKL